MFCMSKQRTNDIENVVAVDGSFQIYNSDNDETLFTTHDYALQLARVNHFGRNIIAAIKALKQGEYIKLRFENGTDIFSNGHSVRV